MSFMAPEIRLLPLLVRIKEGTPCSRIMLLMIISAMVEESVFLSAKALAKRVSYSKIVRICS